MTASIDPSRAGPSTRPAPPAGKVLGRSDAGPAGTVELSVDAARHHLHVIGATGVGKSTLLTSLITQDVRAGRGVVVLDPKGDLITDLLGRLPTHRADGSPVGPVALIDPAHPQHAPTLNPLHADRSDPDQVERVVDQLVGVFAKLFTGYWGPRTDDILRAACLTLTYRGQASLAAIPGLLADPPPLDTLLAGVPDAHILRGFWTWYAAMSEAERGRVIGPLLNKLRAFLLRSFVRRIITAPTPTLNMTAILAGGVLLARLPKGQLGDDTARLLGSLILSATWQAATARAARPGPRPDASVYADECHSFLTLPLGVEDMLAEARGYHLSFVLAHQHLAQLGADTRDAISANARNKIFFALSPEDASRLGRHLAPHLAAEDLTRLAAHQIGCRLVHHGADTDPFTLRTFPPTPPIPGRADRLLAAARAGAPTDRDRDGDRQILGRPLPPPPT